MSKQYTKAQKKSYAIAMSKRANPRANVSAKNVRTVVRRKRPAPVYKSVPNPTVKGSGKYGMRNAGQDIGRGVGHVLERIFGSGDYAIQYNSIMGGVYDPPELHNKSERTICVRHREYICDINASSSFSLQSFPINPGLFTSFPWLSQMADSFEEYRFTGIVYEFKTLSADYTTASSAALGYVVMSTQYNVLSPNFPDKITMENYEFSNSAKPSESFLHPVECKRSLNPVSELFIRTGSVTTGDLRLYDHGNFQIATGGNTGTGIIGELWCTFEIEFYKPKLTGSIGYQLRSDYFVATTGIANSTPLGTLVVQSGSSLGCTMTVTGTTIAFPANISDGFYMVQWVIGGNSTTVVGPAVTTTNCSFQNAWGPSLNISNINNSGSTDDSLIYNFVLKITAQNASFALGTCTVPTSATYSNLYISQINGDIYI